MVNCVFFIGWIMGRFFMWNVSGLIFVLWVSLLIVDLKVRELMVFLGEWVELISGRFMFLILCVFLMNWDL